MDMSLSAAGGLALGRRAVLGGGAMAVATGTAGLPIPRSRRLGFRIMRQGSKIGEHHSTFDLADQALTIRSEVEIAVRLMGVALFRYTHSGMERWTGGRLTSLETRTSDDGTPYTVLVERDASGLVVSGSSQPRYVAPSDALAMTHWNRAEIAVPKINPQKGDLLRPVVADRGVEQIPLASGTLIPAQHYNFSGQAILDVWYDTDDEWAALAFLGGDQSKITLERL